MGKTQFFAFTSPARLAPLSCAVDGILLAMSQFRSSPNIVIDACTYNAPPLQSILNASTKNPIQKQELT
jgi:hypothetical protein